MPSFATSNVDGLAVFYELLSLAEATADERSADEQYRAELGSGFDRHLAAQLEIVRATYAAGLAWGMAYSTHVPRGEFGTHVLDGLHELSRDQFQAARDSGWTAIPNTGNGTTHLLHLSVV